MAEFERRVRFHPAFDRRDPKPSKNYGVGSVRVYFALIGTKGAVSFEELYRDVFEPSPILLEREGNGQEVAGDE